MSPRRLLVFCVVPFAAFTVGCSSCGRTPSLITKDVCVGVEDAQADTPDACDENTACADHHACRDVKDKAGVRCCLYVDRLCSSDADCCPGQGCQTQRNPPRCADRFSECVVDADCGDVGDRACVDWTDRGGTTKRCRHRPCGALGACPDGQSCFQGECVAELPCTGSCAPGEGCVPSADRCQNYASPTGRVDAACPMTCNAGFIATFQDNRNIWDSCKLPDVKCVCAELPGLVSNDVGRFSAVAANGSLGLLASMYDGRYGDLVVYRYDATGARVGVDYVDGVPQGQVRYGPSGARGGITEPGPDVGRYTDIATSNGLAYVSYYDVTNGDLKVAIRSSSTWANHTVDGATGDVGLYSSIAIDSDGLPGVAYFMRSASTGFQVSDCPGTAPTGALKDVTALKFARARVPNPTSASDWTVRTLACLSKPPPPCDGCTGICADTGSGPACLMAASTCMPACNANTEVCVTSGGAARCGRKYNPSQLVDVPMGTGVFASLAFNGKNAIIAYMQRTGPVTNGRVVPDGDLYAVQVDASNTRGAPVLIDGAGDTGYFPDVKIEPNARQVAIAFHDFSTKSLKFYLAPQLQSGVTLETIDTGVDMTRPGEQSFAGTDTAVVFGPQPTQVWAVYQDATRGDLKLARRGSAWVVQPALATEGAVGFFADAVFANGRV
ncbi:MAG: hypothetical protein INH41_18620, partial [Myxococcaceae bacterium]|nr:hypothetical protein [Myxococcaceae bacterium]